MKNEMEWAKKEMKKSGQRSSPGLMHILVSLYMRMHTSSEYADVK